MKTFTTALFLTVLALGINPSYADSSKAASLREGDMRKLIFHETPQPASSAAFQLADGQGTATLAEWQGRFVLLNFWATWCAPCRHEMPMFSELQKEFGGAEFTVLTIAAGRNSPTGIKRFFADIGVDNLPRHQDPNMQLAAEMDVFGLPITVILDPEGNEIARMRGDADWSSDSARAVIAALLE